MRLTFIKIAAVLFAFLIPFLFISRADAWYQIPATSAGCVNINIKPMAVDGDTVVLASGPEMWVGNATINGKPASVQYLERYQPVEGYAKAGYYCWKVKYRVNGISRPTEFSEYTDLDYVGTDYAGGEWLSTSYFYKSLTK